MSSVPTDGRTCQLFRELQGTSVRWNGGALITIYPGKMPKKFTTFNLVRHVAETDFLKICVKQSCFWTVTFPTVATSGSYKTEFTLLINLRMFKYTTETAATFLN